MDYDDYPDGVIIAGADGVVEYVNSRIKVMARAKGDEMLGMHLSEAVPFDDLNGNSWYDCTRPVRRAQRPHPAVGVVLVVAQGQRVPHHRGTGPRSTRRPGAARHRERPQRAHPQPGRS